MPTVVIVLDPERLPNPVADIRYELPDLIASLSKGLLSDDGYDYGEKTNRMYVFMHTIDADAASTAVLQILAANVVLENEHLLDTAIIAVSEQDHDNNAANYRVVHPEGLSQLSFE